MTATTRKRKAPGSVEPPRFISFSMATKTVPITPPPSQPLLSVPSSDDDQTGHCEASFSSLPYELFCNVVSYLGPTSASLCALHQVNRDHHAKLTTIGNIMLQRAHLRFRNPLPPLSIHESSVSLFIRHARVSKIVHDACEILDSVLKKDFPVINTDASADEVKLDLSYLDAIAKIEKESVQPNEVVHALNTALCLLGAGKKHYFENDPNRADAISDSAATSALDWRVFCLCSRLGAKAYKYAKSRMCRRYDHEDYLFSSQYAAVTDEMELDDYSDEEDGDDDDEISLDSREIEIDQDVCLLEKASMVLQLVVLHDCHDASKRISQVGSSASNRILSGSK
eukprot:scaffold15872_cov145-Skeletonema_menzelii.AAC.11